MADSVEDGAAALLARYHAALDRLDYEAMREMFAPDAVYLSNGVGSLKGREAILAAFRDYFGAYVHDESVDTRIEATGPNTARSHWRLLARDRGNGRRIRRSGVETVWFDDAGRIVSVMVDDEPPPDDGPLS